MVALCLGGFLLYVVLFLLVVFSVFVTFPLFLGVPQPHGPPHTPRPAHPTPHGSLRLPVVASHLARPRLQLQQVQAPAEAQRPHLVWGDPCVPSVGLRGVVGCSFFFFWGGGGGQVVCWGVGALGGGGLGGVCGAGGEGRIGVGGVGLEQSRDKSRYGHASCNACFHPSNAWRCFGVYFAPCKRSGV